MGSFSDARERVRALSARNAQRGIGRCARDWN
jgi:hypothetical protein